MVVQHSLAQDASQHERRQPNGAPTLVAFVLHPWRQIELAEMPLQAHLLNHFPHLIRLLWLS